MYRRQSASAVVAALEDTRVVLLTGARQTGKSTLARALVEARGGQYLTLDDPAALGLARSDPDALVTASGDFTVIDEAQHAPELFPAIKRVVDRDPQPGRFLLTGSANVMLLPRVAESLAGRLEVVRLAPLAQCEIADAEPRFVSSLFDGKTWRVGTFEVDRIDVCGRILRGGFPEAVARATAPRRQAWFASYLTALLQRDVRDLAHIEGLTDLPRLLSLLAARTAGLMNASEISRASGIALSTLRRYLALLEATFIFDPLPAWSENLGKRLVKSPKLHLVDSGVAAHLRGDIDPRAISTSPSLGPLLETFVVQEVQKQLAWSAPGARAYHFRTSAGAEVDLMVEDADRRVAGVEVKASSTVDAGDFRGLRAAADAIGRRFTRGIVLYLGEKRLPFGDEMWAVPVSALWTR